MTQYEIIICLLVEWVKKVSPSIGLSNGWTKPKDETSSARPFSTPADSWSSMLRHTAIRMQLLNSTASSVAACSDCSWNEGCQKTFQVVQEHKRVSKIDGDLGQGKYRSIRIGLQRHQSCCLPPLLVTPYLIAGSSTISLSFPTLRSWTGIPRPPTKQAWHSGLLLSWPTSS